MSRTSPESMGAIRGWLIQQVENAKAGHPGNNVFILNGERLLLVDMDCERVDGLDQIYVTVAGDISEDLEHYNAINPFRVTAEGGRVSPEFIEVLEACQFVMAGWELVEKAFTKMTLKQFTTTH